MKYAMVPKRRTGTRARKWCPRHDGGTGASVNASMFRPGQSYCRSCASAYNKAYKAQHRQKEPRTIRLGGTHYVCSPPGKPGPMDGCYLDGGAFRHRCGTTLVFIGSYTEEHEFRCFGCNESIFVPRGSFDRIPVRKGDDALCATA